MEENLIKFLGEHGVNTRRDLYNLNINEFLENITIKEEDSLNIKKWFRNQYFLRHYKENWFSEQWAEELDFEEICDNYGFDPEDPEGIEVMNELELDPNDIDYESIIEHLDIEYCKKCGSIIDVDEDFCTECYDELESEFNKFNDSIPSSVKLNEILKYWKSFSSQKILS